MAASCSLAVFIIDKVEGFAPMAQTVGVGNLTKGLLVVLNFRPIYFTAHLEWNLGLSCGDLFVLCGVTR